MTARSPTSVLVGVLIGGRGRRMGGKIKAELPVPGSSERIVERSLRIAREADLACVLVGAQPAMAPFDDAPPRLADDPAGIGPLGGLRALLREAGKRPALVLGGDMPFVSAGLLTRLARHESSAAVLAPRDPEADRWQPFFARYDAPRVLPVLDRALSEGARSFQALFARLEVEELVLDEEERALLRDWDTPDDVR